LCWDFVVYAKCICIHFTWFKHAYQQKKDPCVLCCYLVSAIVLVFAATICSTVLFFHSIHTAYTPWLCSLFWILQLQYAQHFGFSLNSYCIHTHYIFVIIWNINIYFYSVRIKEWTLTSQLLILFLLCSIFINFLYLHKFFDSQVCAQPF